MTKYILHGGETKVPNEHNKAFYQSWVNDFEPDFIPTILLVYFARPKGEWPKLEQEDKDRFANYTSNRQVNFRVADENADNLRDQIKNADVIYVRGGSSDNVITALLPLKNELAKLLDKKIYTGSSAGVMVMANYTCSINTYWKKGLNIIPINAFVHWHEGLREQLETFKKEHDDSGLEWVLIPETEFIVRTY